MREGLSESRLPAFLACGFILRRQQCHTSSGSRLAILRFVELISASFMRVGIAPEGYLGHSFLIGAVTAAAEEGLQDLTIQVLGK